MHLKRRSIVGRLKRDPCRIVLVHIRCFPTWSWAVVKLLGKLLTWRDGGTDRTGAQSTHSNSPGQQQRSSNSPGQQQRSGTCPTQRNNVYLSRLQHCFDMLAAQRTAYLSQ